MQAFFMGDAMTKTKKPALVDDPAQAVPVDVRTVLTTDEHAGRGGSYVFDPATGKRTLVNEVQITKE